MAVSTSLIKEVIFMSIGYILLLIRLFELGRVSSISVSKNTVTIRIKK